MSLRPAPLSELPALFHAASEGDVPAVVRLALAMENVDRDGDAAKLWRLGAALGDPLAASYARDYVSDDGGIRRSDDDGMVTEVLQRERERLTALVDHRWLDEQLDILLSIPLCHVHFRLEPDRPDDYKSCIECCHVWRTREEFVADVDRTRRELDAARWPDDGAELPTAYLPVIGPLDDDPWASAGVPDTAVSGFTDEDICPLCTSTF